MIVLSRIGIGVYVLALLLMILSEVKSSDFDVVNIHIKNESFNPSILSESILQNKEEQTPECPTADNDAGSCTGNGICNQRTLACVCAKGFVGSDCSHKVKKCPQDCSENGSCNPLTGVCLCGEGWKGDNCSIKQCPKECFKRGDCNEKGICLCYPSYFGEDCGKIRCTPPECNNNGVCNYDTGSCNCFTGYYTKDCSRKQCPESVSSECSSNGSCNFVTGRCTCKPTYYGPGCQFKYCLNECNGHGRCENRFGICKCDFPYDGADCSILRCPNDCTGSNGSCDTAIGKCNCKIGYTSDDCSKTICAYDCSGRGRCNEALGECRCTKGYSGVGCEKKLCVPDCPANTSTCDYVTGKCKCNIGWAGELCEKHLCPRNCISEDYGKCDFNKGKCDCNDHWTGDDCAQRSMFNMWTYKEGVFDPEHWGELDPGYTTCSTGKFQSPVDLTRTTYPDSFNKLNLAYKILPAYRVVNNGRYLTVQYPEGSFIRLQDQKWKLKSIFVKSPSEHLMNGRSYDMEVQLLHESEMGSFAMVAVLFAIDKKSKPKDYIPDFYSTYKDSVFWQKFPEKDFYIEGQNLDINFIFPTEKMNYKTYYGSLTHPPCTEGVQWFILNNIKTVDAEDINRLVERFGKTNRPLQALGRRTINGF